MTPEEQAAETPRERVIDLSVEVVGTPEEVWRAIATGPGISSWYVPTTVEEHEGGSTTSRFGEGDDMVVPGVVTAWEPPHRVVFGGAAEFAGGLAFEWLVQARDQGSCVVRLVNSGFVEGTPWDDQYDGMTEGWGLFLYNLQLHLQHFAGRTAVAMLPMAMWPGTRDEGWARMTSALGIPASPQPGERVETSGDGVPPLAGTVVSGGPHRIALLLDAPASGTAFLACENGHGATCGVSVWQYRYDLDSTAADPAAAGRDTQQWTTWLQSLAPAV